MTWNTGLAGVQLQIAATTNSPVHVLAGPGTGKTLAMMRRIARMLEEGVPPKSILAVSFTRTAARDLREQLTKLDIPGADAVTATTLHSLCFSVLLAEAVFQVTNRRPRPLLSHEIEQVTNDLKKEFGGKKKVKKLIQAYEAAWARLQYETAGTPKTPEDLRFESLLLDWLRYHGAMLIGELVPITLRFIQDNPHSPVLPPFRAVLVDEYQDLNKADQALVEILASQGNLTVIGDENQSIYRFRHANPEGILVFPAQHPGTVAHVIEECWRCPPNIVQMSNALIGHDPVARVDPLKSQPGRLPATAYVLQHATAEDEADALAAYIDHYLSAKPDLHAGQVLVLSPRRIFGNLIRDALILRHRNAMSFFWEDALDTDAAAEGYCLLTLSVDPSDRAAYRAWLGIGSPDGNTAGYRRVRAYAEVNKLEPREVCEKLAMGELQIPYSAKVLERHKQLKTRLAAVAGLVGPALIDALWNAQALEARTIRTAAQTIALTEPAPKDLLVRLREVITQPELPDSSSDVIRIMSLHKSKGLTAQLVVIAGCVAGAIPTIDKNQPIAEQDASMKEQRRLFYVAITRARDALILSSVVRLPLATALKANIPPASIYNQQGVAYARLAASPFLAELGQASPNAVKGTNWRAALGI